MSYKKYKWEVAAHDYNSPFLRSWIWTKSFYYYSTLLKVDRPILGIFSRNNQIEYLTDFSTWMNTHEKLKSRVIKDYKRFEKLINDSVVWGEKMNAWTEVNIFKKDLSKLSNKKLFLLLEKFAEMQAKEYAYGTALPILDFSNFSFIEGNLSRYLKGSVPAREYQEYYLTFTEPLYNSFAQDQEEDLLKLMAEFWSNKKWLSDVRKMDLASIQKGYPKFYNKLSKHAQKHGWVYYVYMGPAFSEKEFYGFIVDFVAKGISPKKHLEELAKKRKNIKDKRKKYIEKLKPQGLDRFVLEIAANVVWAKPRRKDYQSKSYYHVEKLCKEIAKRLYVSLDQIRSCPFDMIEKSLNGKKIDWSITNTIKGIHACLPNDDGTVTILMGKEAEQFSQKAVKRTEVKIDLTKIKELSGTTACSGRASGTVKIINVPEDMVKMNQGDILVSTATTPSVVPAMKKASAILTDEGGLTCHAAIVSREMGTPCVVGLKIATKFLKDGDLVEVDAGKGIVKKVK